MYVYVQNSCIHKYSYTQADNLLRSFFTEDFFYFYVGEAVNPTVVIFEGQQPFLLQKVATHISTIVCV